MVVARMQRRLLGSGHLPTFSCHRDEEHIVLQLAKPLKDRQAKGSQTRSSSGLLKAVVLPDLNRLLVVSSQRVVC